MDHLCMKITLKNHEIPLHQEDWKGQKKKQVQRKTI